MWAISIVRPGHVAVVAEDSKSILGIPVLFKIPIDMSLCAAFKFLAVCFAIAIDVVDGKKLLMSVAATSARIAVCSKDFLALAFSLCEVPCAIMLAVCFVPLSFCGKIFWSMPMIMCSVMSLCFFRIVEPPLAGSFYAAWGAKLIVQLLEARSPIFISL